MESNKKDGSGITWREWNTPLLEMQRLKRAASWSQDEAVITLGDGSRPVALGTYSDMHLGAWSTNYAAHVEFTDQLMATEDFYLALLGDYAHFAIKLRSVLEVCDNLLPPDQQVDYFESWLEEVQDKVAFATWDNHAVEREEKQSGVSSIKRLLSRRVTYFNGIGHIDIKVGTQTYKLAVSHRFRGTSIYNPCHGQMRYMRFEGIDREIAMQGDTHRPGIIKYNDGILERVAINCGSIQQNSGYAKRYFSLFTCPAYPIVVLHPDKHMLTPYWSVQEWLEAKKNGTA
jgi:hypothetical protein